LIDRVVLLIIDSLGIGAMPDAKKYKDSGSNTLGHIIEKMDAGYSLPNLKKFGLLNALAKVPRSGNRFKRYSNNNDQLQASYGVMACISPAKDSTIGHWELAGLAVKEPLPTYPDGFPKSLVQKFEKEIGTKTLGNYAASGTKIINDLGDEHVKTGYPIIYTSADSVFQVAAHEESFGLEKLYHVCAVARRMLRGRHAVGRVIARPFVGGNGIYTRTANRRDFSLDPKGKTLLDYIKRTGQVVAIGKISDLFNHRGITKQLHTVDNIDGMKQTLRESRTNRPAPGTPMLIFTNLVDFDMNWGHRRDVTAYANGLKDFDDFLPELVGSLSESDMLIITADHGCDPTFLAHTDHTREYVPVLVYGKSLKTGVFLGVRKTFSDVSATIAQALGLKSFGPGRSFLKLIDRQQRSL
jgi:phosphopentomutase